MRWEHVKREMDRDETIESERWPRYYKEAPFESQLEAASQERIWRGRRAVFGCALGEIRKCVRIHSTYLVKPQFFSVDFEELSAGRMRNREVPTGGIVTRNLKQLSLQVALDVVKMAVNGLPCSARLQCERSIDQCITCGNDEEDSIRQFLECSAVWSCTIGLFCGVFGEPCLRDEPEFRHVSCAVLARFFFLLQDGPLETDMST